MNALKALVIVMGVLILAGFALVVYKFADIVASDGDAGAAFERVSLGLPAGCAIVASASEDDRLVVRTASAEPIAGCGIVYVIDLERGAIVGTVAP